MRYLCPGYLIFFFFLCVYVYRLNNTFFKIYVLVLISWILVTWNQTCGSKLPFKMSNLFNSLLSRNTWLFNMLYMLMRINRFGDILLYILCQIFRLQCLSQLWSEIQGNWPTFWHLYSTIWTNVTLNFMVHKYNESRFANQKRGNYFFFLYWTRLHSNLLEKSHKFYFEVLIYRNVVSAWNSLR